MTTFFLMQMTAANERLERARLAGDLQQLQVELATMTRLVKMQYGKRHKDAEAAGATTAA